MKEINLVITSGTTNEGQRVYGVDFSPWADKEVPIGKNKEEEVSWVFSKEWDIIIVFLKDSPFRKDDAHYLSSRNHSENHNNADHQKLKTLKIKGSNLSKGDYPYVVVLINRNNGDIFFHPHGHDHGPINGVDGFFHDLAWPPVYDKNSPPKLVVV